ncbi:hypothetical protein F4703DRAFT_1972972 [Phycomyces blakesleeanus]
MLLKIQDDSAGQGTFKLPKLNVLMKYQHNKKNRIPILPTMEVKDLSSDPPTVIAEVTLLSTHIELSITHLEKCKKIFSLSDQAPDQSTCFQQGKKWKDNKYLQQSMFTVDTLDIWAGNVLTLKHAPNNARFLIKSFHTTYNSLFARRYWICINATSDCYVESTILDIEVDCLDTIDMEAKARNFATCTPTDDTSDNQSKRYNPYKSWSMKFAAVSYEEHCMAINILLLGIVQKRNGYSSLSLLPTLIKNFNKLENGMVMYSAEHGEDVLVVASLLLIEADTPCHSELCGILGPATLLPCFKEYFLKKHMPRTREHYVMANSTDKCETIMPDVLETNTSVNARALSFVNHLSGCLFELKAFDPLKDILVEILHMILLGTAKYLINELVKEILKPHSDKLERLAYSLKEHDILTGFSCKFIQLLRYSGSFLENFPMIRQIESKFEEYIAQVNHAVNSIIAKLHEFDMANVANPKHFLLSTKPKTHNMTHLTEDIRQFGPALNFETEKSKYNGQQEYSGFRIAEFIKSNDDRDKTFCNIFLRGSQVFANNNDTGNITTLKNNSFAAFVIKNSIGMTPSIGLISGLMVTFLWHTAHTSEKMKNNYLKVEMTDDHMPFDSLKSLCKIDLIKVNDTTYMVNLSKFGSY